MSEESFSLNKTQDLFMSALMDPQETKSGEAQSLLKGNSRLSAEQSLKIYQHSYIARLRTCLSEQFPALSYSLGDDAFNALAEDYLSRCPSNSYTLYDLGRSFANHLDTTRPDRHLPKDQREVWIDFMVDLARFEYLVFRQFEARGEEGSLANPESVTELQLLRPQYGLTVYASSFPLASYYCAVRDDLSPQLPPLQQTYLAIARVEYRTRLIYLKELEYHVLEAFITYGDIHKALSRVAQQRSLEIKQLWERWSGNDGWRYQWLTKGFLAPRS